METITAVLITLFTVMSSVSGEGYYCPYPEIGFDGSNDLIYDYYDSFDNGATWQRLGQTGWMSRESYCNAKGDGSIHFDAGEAKCIDSVDKCVWSQGVCIANVAADADCLALCQQVLADAGPACLGGTCGNREDFYAICDSSEPPVQEPPVQEPPVQEPPVQEPPVQEPPAPSTPRSGKCGYPQ